MRLLAHILILNMLCCSVYCTGAAAVAAKAASLGVDITFKAITFAYNMKKHNEMMLELARINQKADELASMLENDGLNRMFEIILNMADKFRFEHQKFQLERHIDDVNIAYNQMRYYLNNSEDIQNSTWENFASSIINHNANSLFNTLERIHQLLVPNNIGFGAVSTLHGINKELKNGICGVGSQQQIVKNLYDVISLTELKGYLTIQFSYIVLKFLGKGYYYKEVLITYDQFQSRKRKTINAINKVLHGSHRKYWECGPTQYTEDVNYVQITNFLQGYILNEADLNGKRACFQNCAYYSYTRNYGCYEDTLCGRDRVCRGRILKCYFVESYATVCKANNNANRRYDHVQYESGHSYGKSTSSCSSINIYSWWRWLFWHCSYCMCICDDPGLESDRYFSLQKVVSNVAKNSVITGVKFVKKNRIIHIQIQEGKLIENGRIDSQTIRWVPVNNFKITDTEINNGEDFHMLTWERRSMNLDDVKGSSDEVLTGIRLSLEDRNLLLQIHLTPFDYKTGRLDVTKSYWKKSDTSKRTKLNLEDNDVPTNIDIHPQPDSKDGQYIQFTHTGMKQDVAQTTVPFVDIQSVDRQVPTPLSGAGVYHKGYSKYGGFIGLSIFNYDIYVVDDIDDNDDSELMAN